VIGGIGSGSVLRRAGATLVVVAVAALAGLGASAPGSVRPSTRGATGSTTGAAVAASREVSARPTGLGIYRGLGSWVDIYDFSALEDPEGSIADMAAHGVRTLYLETSNFRRGRAFVHREAVERFIEAAHDHGMAVVAWYLPGFADPDLDLKRSLLAIDLRTANRGDAFDSFALDIESPEVESPSVRTQRLLEISEGIREAVGEDYTLGAIIPSPRGMQVHPDYWPGFPYPELNELYDVFVPMTYFTWRTEGLVGAHNYAMKVIQIIRNEVGSWSVPIHVIGGISDESTTMESRGFVRALRERGVIGGSYYSYPGTTEGQWDELAQIPVNPVQSPGLPAKLPYGGELGNVPGSDQTHPKDVSFTTAPKDGDWVLAFQAYDVHAGEITLRVNWKLVKVLSSGPKGAWTGTRYVTIPDWTLSEVGTNYIQFTAEGDHPGWSDWGVRALSIAPADEA
jgi:hypothetical protein